MIENAPKFKHNFFRRNVKAIYHHHRVHSNFPRDNFFFKRAKPITFFVNFVSSTKMFFKNLMMTGVEPRTSGVVSDRSAK